MLRGKEKHAAKSMTQKESTQSIPDVFASLAKTEARLDTLVADAEEVRALVRDLLVATKAATTGGATPTCFECKAATAPVKIEVTPVPSTTEEATPKTTAFPRLTTVLPTRLAKATEALGLGRPFAVALVIDGGGVTAVMVRAVMTASLKNIRVVDATTTKPDAVIAIVRAPTTAATLRERAGPMAAGVDVLVVALQSAIAKDPAAHKWAGAESAVRGVPVYVVADAIGWGLSEERPASVDGLCTVTTDLVRNWPHKVAGQTGVEIVGTPTL